MHYMKHLKQSENVCRSYTHLLQTYTFSKELVYGINNQLKHIINDKDGSTEY